MRLLIIFFVGCGFLSSANGDEFDPIDVAANRYLKETGLSGAGVLVISRDDGVLYEAYYGNYAVETQISIASAAKWISGAILMTVVEAGSLSLDDPAMDYLPQLKGEEKAKITIRQLFNHTSGYPDASREKNVATTLAEAADNIGPLSLRFSPGSGFLYGGGAMQLAGRAVEVAENDWPWVAIFAKRLAEPLEMKSTVYTTELNQNPKIAGGIRTTMRDYGNFLTMLLHDGQLNGRRVLSAESVTELMTDRTRERMKRPEGFVVHGFAAARNDRQFQGYGIGCWVEAKIDGKTKIASSPGAFGFNPWIDLENGYAAIWMIEDRERVRRGFDGLPDLRKIISTIAESRQRGAASD